MDCVLAATHSPFVFERSHGICLLIVFFDCHQPVSICRSVSDDDEFAAVLMHCEWDP